MIVLHANWIGGRLHLWGETERDGLATCEQVRHAIAHAPSSLRDDEISLRLPASESAILSSSPLARWRGDDESATATLLRAGTIASCSIAPLDVAGVLDRLLDVAQANRELTLAPSIAFAERATALARHILAQQRFVPMLCHNADGDLTAAWRPWLADEKTRERATRLLETMPPAFRAIDTDPPADAWSILDDMLWRIIDASCREVLEDEDMSETIRGRDLSDPHVAWLAGLLDGKVEVKASGRERQGIIRGVRGWIARLEERGASSTWRLCLRLNEPLDALLGESAQAVPNVPWSLSFHLQAGEAEHVLVDAADIWLLPSDGVSIEGLRLDDPHELLLGELARAARLFKPIEKALEESDPVDLELDTRQAYEFLREIRPILLEQGFGVQIPDWWETSRSRLGARMKIEDAPEQPEQADTSRAITSSVGLSALVGYRWEIAVGDTTLSLREFEQLAALKAPLVRMGGKWVEIRPEDVENAVKFIQENPGGTMPLGDAMRLAFGTDPKKTGIPVVGMEATGWVSSLLGESAESMPLAEPPKGFRGTLRPYQVRGLSWMRFLERFGFGLCLADDMGLGKTIQMLALLQLEREESSVRMPPTLLIAPTSVLANWYHEAKRFTPDIKVHIHHGVDRLQGAEFVQMAAKYDIVVTTYALAYRDIESIENVAWHRIVLDEAQFIKNPNAKQTQAVRSIPGAHRAALTGTPVENRLGELWSIMDFLNPGYLGSPGQFRTRFAAPIERRRDKDKAAKLRSLVQPFILRRLKTDANVVSDLPAKIETKEHCVLTPEQAEMYENTVARMIAKVDSAEGIQRRGEVLAGLIKLKQICNHPSQVLKDVGEGERVRVSRSGKCIRLIEQLDEVLAEGDQSLIFTQFRQMGDLLARMLRHELDREILFLHGGTPRGQREKMINRFQKADGTTPILILSLRAGGVGLNLTAATHVFHFDRWWNPAVENQATDRAHRIGQTRTVMVHKYLVRGTLEDRIDEMIEQKTELADNIIGTGESWLTDLDTSDLRDLLSLRDEAIGDDA